METATRQVPLAEWSPEPSEKLRPSARTSFASAADDADVAPIEPVLQQTSRFVSLGDDAQPKRPGMQRTPSRLSRSGTLHSLSAASRKQSQSANHFQNFNHHNWVTSIRWIFKGQSKEHYVLLLCVMSYAVGVVVIVEASGVAQAADLLQDCLLYTSPSPRDS